MEFNEHFQRLAVNATCYFLDYKVLSKRTVHELTKQFDTTEFRQLHKGVVVVHTCLRLEIYAFELVSFDTCLSIPMAVLRGPLAIRRLLALALGIVSEIVGEQEIWGQVQKSIEKSLNAQSLSKELLWDLLALLDYTKSLRDKYNLNCVENYSTVGAEMFNDCVQGLDKGIVAVIGSGYMAEYFISCLNLGAVSKVLWVNRNIDKAAQLEKDIFQNQDILVEHVELDSSADILKQVDFIFAATTGTQGYFNNCCFENAKIIVDVSYPSMFSEEKQKNLHCINNTFFEKYIKKPIPKSRVYSVEQELDKLLLNYKL